MLERIMELAANELNKQSKVVVLGQILQEI